MHTWTCFTAASSLFVCETAFSPFLMLFLFYKKKNFFRCTKISVWNCFSPSRPCSLFFGWMCVEPKKILVEMSLCLPFIEVDGKKVLLTSPVFNPSCAFFRKSIGLRDIEANALCLPFNGTGDINIQLGRRYATVFLRGGSTA